MPTILGSGELSSVYLGSSVLSKIMLGPTEVYPNSVAQAAPSGEDQILNFYVPSDDTSPTLSSMSPADGSVDVVNSTRTFALNFSEPVVAGTGVIEFRYEGGALIESFDVVSDITTSAPTAGEVRFNGTTVVFELSSDLPSASGLCVRIAATAVTDEAGNSYAGITDDSLNITSASTSSALYLNEFDGSDTAYNTNNNSSTAGGTVVTNTSGDIAGVAESVGNLTMNKNGGNVRFSWATTGEALNGLTVDIELEIVTFGAVDGDTLSVYAQDQSTPAWAYAPASNNPITHTAGSGSAQLHTVTFTSVTMGEDNLGVYIANESSSAADFSDVFALTKVTVT